MENKEESLIEKFETEGYEEVYVYIADVGEEEPDHDHPFDVHLYILEGEILVRIGEDDNVLMKNMEIDIPRGTIHYGKAGTNGCAYIFAARYKDIET